MSLTQGSRSKKKTAESDEYAEHRLPDGERLTRASCLRMCIRFFEKEVENAGLDDEKQKERAMEMVGALCAKLDGSYNTIADPITLVIRSVPVRMYANVLRHYYLRVEDVLDVHPGTNHRLALAWWHNSTVQENDVHERSLRLCGECCDQFLDQVWQKSERFNIIWNNCDIMLNRCEQSFIIGILLLNTLWYPLFRDYMGLLLLVVCLIVYAVTANQRNLHAYMDLNCNRIFHCSHVTPVTPI
jgi:hypothetical protein